MHAHPPRSVSNEQRISSLCGAVCGLLAVGLPAVVVLFWALMSPEQLAHSFRMPIPRSGVLEPWQRLLGACANLASAGLLAYGLWRARSCLLDFSRGNFFDARTIRGLRDFAGAVFWAVVASFLEESVTSVIVTWTNGPGLRELTFGIGSPQVFSALYAGIFWVIAAAMTRAAILAKENEQFV